MPSTPRSEICALGAAAAAAAPGDLGAAAARPRPAGMGKDPDTWTWAPWWNPNAERAPTCQGSGAFCFFYANRKWGQCCLCGRGEWQQVDIRVADRLCQRCWEVTGTVPLQDNVYGMSMCTRHHNVAEVGRWRDNYPDAGRVQYLLSLPDPLPWTPGPVPPPGTPMPPWAVPRPAPSSVSASSAWLATPPPSTGTVAAATVTPAADSAAGARIQRTLDAIVARLDEMQGMLEEVGRRQDGLERNIHALQQEIRRDSQPTWEAGQDWQARGWRQGQW